MELGRGKRAGGGGREGARGARKFKVIWAIVSARSDEAGWVNTSNEPAKPILYMAKFSLMLCTWVHASTHTRRYTHTHTHAATCTHSNTICLCRLNRFFFFNNLFCLYSYHLDKKTKQTSTITISYTSATLYIWNGTSGEGRLGPLTGETIHSNKLLYFATHVLSSSTKKKTKNKTFSGRFAFTSGAKVIQPAGDHWLIGMKRSSPIKWFSMNFADSGR